LIALIDRQLSTVMQAAKALPVKDRDRFLRLTASHLQPRGVYVAEAVRNRIAPSGISGLA